MTDPLTLWAVYTNTDLTEGRGRQYVKHFCRSRATALRLGKQGYVQGSDCPVEPVKVLLLDGQHVLPTAILKIEEPSKEDVVADKAAEAFTAALARAKANGLTDEELAILQKGPKP